MSPNSKSLDPRTKGVILLLVTIFILGGAGGTSTIDLVLRYILIAIPTVFLILHKKYKFVIVSSLIYLISLAMLLYMLPNVEGALNFIILIIAGTIARFLPGILAGYYLMYTTTVGEFVGGLQSLKLSEKIIIPLSVIFRFFPTLMEEAISISNAMKMRGVFWGGGKFSKFIEYRFIPLITCSVIIGEELSAAALTRGLGSPIKRTNICQIGFGILDYIILLFSLIFISILLVF